MPRGKLTPDGEAMVAKTFTITRAQADALEAARRSTGVPESHIVREALAKYGYPLHAKKLRNSRK